MQPFDSTAIIIRPGIIEDAEAIAAHRRAMFFEMGYHDDVTLDATTAAFLLWLRQRVNDAEYLAWVAIGPDGAVRALDCS